MRCCFDVVVFAAGCVASRTVSQIFTCDLATSVWPWDDPRQLTLCYYFICSHNEVSKLKQCVKHTVERWRLLLYISCYPGCWKGEGSWVKVMVLSYPESKWSQINCYQSSCHSTLLRVTCFRIGWNVWDGIRRPSLESYWRVMYVTPVPSPPVPSSVYHYNISP